MRKHGGPFEQSVRLEARLIHTSRAGKAVPHTMTPLGSALLDGGRGLGLHLPLVQEGWA